MRLDSGNRDRMVEAQISLAERPLLGVGLRCCSATSFALMGALLKVASNHGATVVELVFFRSIGAFPIVAGWVLAQGGWAAIAVRNPMAHLTRSAIGLTSMGFTFAALALLPLAQATTLTYSAPILATLLSALILREQVGPRRWAAVLAGFVGVVLVAQPFGHRTVLLGLMVALGAAVTQALVMITLRQISRTEQITAIVFWFTVMTSSAAALALPFATQSHSLTDYMILACGGLLGGTGQLTMTASLRYAAVSIVTPFDYLQIIWATAIGWLFLASPPAPLMLLGAALIAASGLYTAWRETRRGLIAAQALAAPEA